MQFAKTAITLQRILSPDLSIPSINDKNMSNDTSTNINKLKTLKFCTDTRVFVEIW